MKSSFSGNGGCVDVDFAKSSFSEFGQCVHVGFVRSSFCGHPGCVEVAHESEDKVLVRDSKDPEGPVLTFTQWEWDAFVAGILNGELRGPKRPVENGEAVLGSLPTWEQIEATLRGRSGNA